MERLLSLSVVLVAWLGSVCAIASDDLCVAKTPFDADRAKEIQELWAEHIGTPVVYTNSIGMKLALVPPGEFTMGRTEEQFDQLVDLFQSDPKLQEQRGGMIVWSMLMMPAHRVRITKPFYLGATEVTVGQFRQFVEATGYKTEAEQGLVYGRPYQGTRPLCTWRRPMVWRRPPLVQKDDEPVMHLCWNDCAAFCKWLTEKEKVGFSPNETERPLAERAGRYELPTEAEWEYACRAGRATPWNFGGFDEVERLGRQYAIWSDTGQKFDLPQPVGQRKPNAFGLYDMHGNMWEYVGDWWHRLSYKESPLNDPTGPAEQSEMHDQRRIIRGGSFDWGRWGADAAYRMRIVQRSNQHPHMSFRVAMRISGVKGIPPAVDPDFERRAAAREPGADAKAVVEALEEGRLKQKKELPQRLTISLGEEVDMQFVLIPAGSFLMGSTRGPKDERPVHRVVISRTFYMAAQEVTQAQWEAVMGAHERLARWRTRQPKLVGPCKPMTDLSWQDCRQFLARLNQKVAVSVRETDAHHAERDGYFALPTEAQWEYVCRAGTQTEFCCGDDESLLGDYAWYAGNKRWPEEGRTYDFFYDVGTKKPNRFGLYDMHGGVWEWCADWYDADYYLHSPLVDPAGPADGRFKVLRGGSWFRYGKYARSAYRRFCHPEGTGDGFPGVIGDFGCRVVINLDDQTKAAVRRGAPDPAETPDRKVSAKGQSADDSARPAVGTVARSGDRPQRSVGDRPEPRVGDRSQRDYTQLARSLVRYPHNPVIRVGEKGDWDDQTLGCFTVLDGGDRFYFYSGGAQYGKPKNIGMATSTDGIHWIKNEENPLFPGAMPYAIKVGDTFRLYHPGNDNSGRHGLLMRTSKDGFHWSESQLVLAGGIMDPCVVRVGGKYYLYYCGGGRKIKDGKEAWEFKAYLATSEDGIHWKKEPKPALPLGPPGSWDAQSHAGPCVLKLDDGFHMWYLGSGDYNGKVAWRIGHATSPDGLNWAKSGTEPVLDVGKPGDWDCGTFMSFDIIYRDGGFLFWYAAAPTGHGDETKMTIQIGHGTSSSARNTDDLPQ